MNEAIQVMLCAVISSLLMVFVVFDMGEYELRYEKEPCVCSVDGGVE